MYGVASFKMVSTFTSVIGLLAFFFPCMPAAASHSVYCQPSVDGVSTCIGWKGNETLNCVSSVGNVASCTTRSGRKVTCSQDRNQIASCVENIQLDSKQAELDKEECTFIGSGSYSCQHKKNGSNELLPLKLEEFESDIIKSRPIKLK